MDFTLKERYLLLNALPEQGDFRTIKTIAALRDELLVSEQEVADFKIVADGDRIMWDTACEKPKTIGMGPVATTVVVDTLKAMNADKKLTLDYVSLYEKFIEG